MQKIVKILLVGILALTLAACTSETMDAASIYENARANMEALDSYTMESTIAMTVTGESEDGTEEEVSMSTDVTYVFVGLTTDSASEYYATTASYSDGEEINTEMWLIDGVVYFSYDGYYYTAEVEDEEVTTVDIFSYIDETEAITATDSEDGYTLELTIDGAAFLEIMAAVSEDSSSDLIADATIEDAVVFTMEVDGDGYITSVSVSVTMELADIGTMVMTLEFTYYDFDSATLPELDTDSFESLDTSVYGDYDLTTDYIDELIAAGYEEADENIYYNADSGYVIDLDLKQIYSSEAIYDWEYDQGVLYDEDFNFTCAYDYYNGLSSGDCDFTVIEELREAYNELASSILGS